MNKCMLKGVLRGIEFSHMIGDVEFDKACLVTKDGDVIDIKFKKFSNKYSDGDDIELVGNVRSYSHKLEDGRNKVELYVFTYFDLPESGAYIEDTINEVSIDGRICKINEIKENKSNKQSLHFILANNIKPNNSDKNLNNYIPCICFGNIAKEASDFTVNTEVTCFGKLHSREYKKRLDSGEFEIRVAHELLIEKIIKK